MQIKNSRQSELPAIFLPVQGAAAGNETNSRSFKNLPVYLQAIAVSGIFVLNAHPIL